jgi:hypothetical protein
MVDGRGQKCSCEGEFIGFLKIYLKFELTTKLSVVGGCRSMVDGRGQKCSCEGEFIGFLKICLKFLFGAKNLPALRSPGHSFGAEVRNWAQVYPQADFCLQLARTKIRGHDKTYIPYRFGGV